MILKYLQIWCKYLRLRKECFFVFIVPVKRTTDNLNLRFPKYVTLLGRGLHDLHSRENKIMLNTNLNYHHFWFLIMHHAATVSLRHSPFNTKVMIYTAQCAAIFTTSFAQINYQILRSNRAVKWNRERTLFMVFEPVQKWRRWTLLSVFGETKTAKWLVGTRTQVDSHQCGSLGQSRKVSRVGCDLWPPCDFNNSGSMARIF